MKKSTEVDNYIDSAPDALIELLKEIRDLIHSTISDTTEAIKWGFPVFGNPKDFSYIRFNQKHVTFGFYHFERIQEKADKLEGTGNTMRHIKLKVKDDIDKDIFSNWLNDITSNL